MVTHAFLLWRTSVHMGMDPSKRLLPYSVIPGSLALDGVPRLWIMAVRTKILCLDPPSRPTEVGSRWKFRSRPSQTMLSSSGSFFVLFVRIARKPRSNERQGTALNEHTRTSAGENVAYGEDAAVRTMPREPAGSSMKLKSDQPGGRSVQGFSYSVAPPGSEKVPWTNDGQAPDQHGCR